jgi:DNA-binding transcriptional ArsR family regulator
MIETKNTPERNAVKGTGSVLLSQPAQFRAVASPIRVALLEILAHGPATVRTLAGELGVPRTRLYHHLKILEASQLIEVAGERRVRGVIERTYGSVADEVSLDPGLFGEEGLEAVARAPVRAAFRLAESELVGAVESGQVSDVVVEQHVVRLQRARYRELRERLMEWLDDLRDSHDPNAELSIRATVAMHPSAKRSPAGGET